MKILLASMLLAMAPQASAAPLMVAEIDTRGPCLDSPAQVPDIMGEPREKSSEVVRIDKIISTDTYTLDQVIGFLYTRSDKKTYLGMRKQEYMSPATAAELNRVLASTHAPMVKESVFPPQTMLGVRTGNARFLEVKIPSSAFDALHIRIDSCVQWPIGRRLPDPGP